MGRFVVEVLVEEYKIMRLLWKLYLTRYKRDKTSIKTQLCQKYCHVFVPHLIFFILSFYYYYWIRLKMICSSCFHCFLRQIIKWRPKRSNISLLSLFIIITTSFHPPPPLPTSLHFFEFPKILHIIKFYIYTHDE